jgi:hypothetical protein
VPIFVEYQSIARRCISDAENLEWEAPVVAELTLDRIFVYENGSTFGFDDTWSLNVGCRVNGRDFAVTDGTIWESQSPICDGGDEPAMDVIAGPGGWTTYCSYTLDWLQRFDLAPGDSVHCTVDGTAEDNTIPVPPSHIDFTVMEANTNSMDMVGAGSDSVSAEYNLFYTLKWP